MKWMICLENMLSKLVQEVENSNVSITLENIAKVVNVLKAYKINIQILIDCG